MTLFNIEFGQKEDIFTKIFVMAFLKCSFYYYKIVKLYILAKNKTRFVKINETIIPSEESLKNEFLSNIDKGAYLYKYSGLWSLGMDMLPSIAQRSLHLFFYRGCVCEVNVWFKSPTTPSSTIPLIPNKTNEEYLNNVEICQRFTDNLKHPLGNIHEEEKVVEFKLRTSNVGKNGLIKLFEDVEKVLLEINFNTSIIEFAGFGFKNVQYTRDINQNLMDIGAMIHITMRLNKYFVFTSVEVNDFPSLYYKLFTRDWWNGKLFEKSNTSHILVHGDFVEVTPIYIRAFKESHIYKLANKMGQIIQMPYSFGTGLVISDSILFRFRCLINNDGKWFYIKLRKDVAEKNDYVGKTIFGMEIDLKLSKVITYPDITSYKFEERWSDNKMFKKGIPFECDLKVIKHGVWTIITIFVNGIELVDNEIKTDLPITLINLISVEFY
uniref:Galectin n=1 Tax=Meloidogyne hapla TaxID=6305 RepID=A0A1I8AX42_MELHA